MSRTIAVTWHAIFSVVAGVLYFFFVLPRWYELSGDLPHTLGTVMRIVCGVLIGLAALPVVFTLLRTRRPELGSPQMALTLRTWSIVLHVLAGLLIIGAAISEIWLSLDDAGRWLFGIYGAAAAIALLGIFAFYLAWVAELPPPPPKPVKVKAPKQRRRGKGSKDDDDAEPATDDVAEAEDDNEDDENTEPADGTDENESSDTEAATDEDDDAEVKADADADESASKTTDEAESAEGKLRNRRPEPARRRRRRLRGGVAVDD
nr:hypothetical protein [Mycolicibacterium komanii]CRL73849.1 transmembrane protein [Mycolicibacterium komanii]